MSDPMYKDAVGRFSRLIDAEFLRMEAIYNFDYGDEFEIACCHVLRSLLPARFGVCRGHLVTADNQQAGDDIIVYDRDLSPTLRLLPGNDFSRKEYVPVESAYAYLEAKHTLVIDANGNFTKALAQIAAAKRLPRSVREHDEVLPGFIMDVPLTLSDFVHPDRANPLLGGVLSRNFNPGPASLQALTCATGNPAELPDLIVAGPDLVALPVRTTDEGVRLRSFREPVDRLCCRQVTGRAMAIGMLAIVNALHFIDLHRVNWHQVILNELHRPGES